MIGKSISLILQLPINGAPRVSTPVNLGCAARVPCRHVLQTGRIFSRDVLRRIKDHDATWETMVPPEIAQAIKDRHYFGYRQVEATEDVVQR